MLTEAVREENVADLWARIDEHRAHLESEGRLEERRRRNLAGEVLAVASSRARLHLERTVAGDAELQRVLEAVERRELDPLTAVRDIIREVFHIGDENGSHTR